MADYSDAADAATVSTLLNGYALDQFGNSAPLDDAVRAHLCAHLAKVQGAFSVIASVGDTPVGLINAFQGFSTFKCEPLINVHDVFVEPAHRRKGITQRMMEKVQEIAVSRGCCKLTLEVLSNNPNAMGSYAKFGFKSYELDPELGDRAVLGEETLKRETFYYVRDARGGARFLVVVAIKHSLTRVFARLTRAR